MARAIGQITRRGSITWLVRIYAGRDPSPHATRSDIKEKASTVTQRVPLLSRLHRLELLIRKRGKFPAILLRTLFLCFG